MVSLLSSVAFLTLCLFSPEILCAYLTYSFITPPASSPPASYPVNSTITLQWQSTPNTAGTSVSAFDLNLLYTNTTTNNTSIVTNIGSGFQPQDTNIIWMVYPGDTEMQQITQSTISSKQYSIGIFAYNNNDVTSSPTVYSSPPFTIVFNSMDASQNGLLTSSNSAKGTLPTVNATVGEQIVNMDASNAMELKVITSLIYFFIPVVILMMLLY